MKIRSKIFWSVFGSSVALVIIISSVVFHYSRLQVINQYQRRYELANEIIGNTLRQLEAMSDMLSASALVQLADKLKSNEIPSNAALHAMAEQLNVSRLYVIDHQGRFIRDSDDELIIHTKTLFEHCDGYRNLVDGTTPFAVTPIIPSNPYKGAYKFRMEPAGDGSHIIEVGMKLNFLGDILGHVLNTDENILSVGLFTPTGYPLGYFSKDKTQWQFDDVSKKIEEQSVLDLSKDNAMFIRHLDAGSGECCECKVKNISGESARFYYILRTEASLKPLQNSINQLISFTAISVTVSLLLAFLFASYISKLILYRLNQMNKTMTEIVRSGDSTIRLNVEGNDEASIMAVNFNNMLATLNSHQQELVAAERDQSLTKIAAQVAHDVRSPLAALDTVLSHSKVFDESQRVTLRTASQRIHDIVNGLLHYYRESKDRRMSSSRVQSENLWPLVESIVSEKRVQYSSYPNVQIIAKSTGQAHLLFSDVGGSDLRRVLSNLIDNGFDALSGSTGTIEVYLHSEGKSCVIEVVDSGLGMSESLIDSIMKGAAISSRERGHGLGLAFAREKVEAWQAEWRIESGPGQGTKIEIRLARSIVPEWFVTALILEGDEQIVVIDDDKSIHEVWRQRLADHPVPILDFYSINDFKKWFQFYGESLAKARFLLDFEFVGSPQTGFDVILELGLMSRAILVTSHGDETSRHPDWLAHDIKVIPKSLAADLSIIIRKPQTPPLNCVLIDNDIYLRQAWKMAANSKNIAIETVANLEQLLQVIERSHATTKFFVDYNLDIDFDGIEIAHILHQMGVRHIYLNTGMPVDDLNLPAWLKVQSSKEFPVTL